MAESQKVQHYSQTVFDISNEIVTPTKIGGFLMFDFAYGVIILSLALKISNMVHHSVKILALLFVVLIGVFWILPSPVSKKKRNFELLLYGFTMSRSTLHPIDVWPFDSNEVQR